MTSENRRCPNCRRGIWNPIYIHFIHLLLDEYVDFCPREDCQELFPSGELLENHAERCLMENPVTEHELEHYIQTYTPNAFCDVFYYNLPLIYRLAEYASVDEWWYILDLQDFLNEDDFGGGNDIFM